MRKPQMKMPSYGGNRNALGPQKSRKSPVSTESKPARVTNAEFLHAAFPELSPNEVMWYTTFKGDPSNKAEAKWNGNALFSREIYDLPERNAFISNSTFRTDIGRSVFRQDKFFSRLHFVVIDDVGTKVPMSTIDPLLPSALIMTSPGNHQAYYFFEQPIDSYEIACSLFQAMRDKKLGDTGAEKIGQYTRLPVGSNTKRDYRTPFQHKLVNWSPGNRYTLEELVAAFKLQLRQPKDEAPTRISAPSESRPTWHGIKSDHFLELLDKNGLYLRAGRKTGQHEIVCPWCYLHTGQDQGGMSYFEPDEEYGWRGGFKCFHDHCSNRNINDFALFMVRLIERNTDENR